MNQFNDDRVIIKPLEKFNLEEGDVFHALKASEPEFNGFQEAYFSTIKKDRIKGWKRHLRMTMNLIVPVGNVQFNFYDDRKLLIKNIVIGEKNYSRITVPPMIWFGFKGISNNTSYILNISDVLHDPSEQERKPLTFLNFISK
tara:strand:+ start:1239 stop:1667 length:429 start_codon:yes stop_codon:yes gene_type:complete